MNITIIGNKSGPGRRYECILKYLGHSVTGYDFADDEKGRKLPIENERVIIATPTNLHMRYLRSYLSKGCFNLLCEKPLASTHNELQELAKLQRNSFVFWVCNWRYTRPCGTWNLHSHSVGYNYYNWGRNNDDLDIVQLWALSEFKPLAKDTSPLLKAHIDDMPITQADIEKSYILMLDAWLQGERLWTVQDAIQTMVKIEGSYNV